MNRLLALAAFVAGLGFLLYLYTPGVVADAEFAVSGVQPIPAPGLRHARQPECRSKLWLVTTCVVSYSTIGEPDVRHGLDFAFVGPAPEERVMLVRSPQTGLVSTRTQIDLYGRRVTLLVIIAGMLIAVPFLAFRRGRPVAEEPGGGDRPQPAAPERAAARAPFAKGERPVFGRR